jgi:hypothetical protein
MPVQVVGLKEAQKAMRALQPTLNKELNKEIKVMLKPIITKARGYALSDPPGLRNWTIKGGSRQITKATSHFAPKTNFPLYQASVVRAGIKSETFPSKPNRNGFISLVRIVNASRAGAIYEIAGIKNPGGRPWDPKNKSHNFSHSRNPDAGAHFINSLGATKGNGKMRGRLIYKAWAEDQGRALGHIMKAIEATSKRTVTFSNSVAALRKVA